MTTVLVGLHLLFVQRQGMSVPIAVAQRVKRGERIKQMPFFPDYVLRDVLVWYVAIALLAALAAFYPWELGRKADAFAPVPAGIRPEWYFLAMFHTLKLLPAHILGVEGEVVGIMTFTVAAAILLLVPFLDSRASKDEPSPLFTALGICALVYLVALTIIGHLAS
jgi:cytochrome b6